MFYLPSFFGMDSRAGHAAVNTVAPVASGTGVVGDVLSVTNGTWTSSAPITYSYQWQRDGVTNIGTNANTYTIVSGDFTHTVNCVVTATTIYGSSSTSSAPVTIFSAPVNTVAPVASGVAVVGGTVSCSTGTWTGTATITFGYQWRKNGSDIGAATNPTYVIQAGDDTASIDCNVTGTNAYGNSTHISNALTAGTAPANTVAPVASGTGVVGQTLSVTNGTWTGTATIAFGYQWRRDASNIGSATASTYLLVTADSGHAIDCVVTGTNAYGNASQDSNDISIAVAPVNTVAGVLSGSTSFGSTLTCTSGTWTGTATITFTYQFKADGVNIGSPGGNTYVTLLADGGKTITCVPIGTNAAGAVNGTASNGIVVQAASLLPGYRVYYDVAQLAGKVDGDLISSLPDLAGIINANQSASGTARPTYRTNVLNGNPALEFDGTSDFMSFVGSTFYLTGASTIYCVIASVPAPALASYAMPFGCGGTAGNGVRYCNSYTNAGTSTINCGVGSGAVCSVVITPGENIILAMRYDGSNSLMRLNGDVLRQSTTTINAATGATGAFDFGQDPLSANHWAAFKLLLFVNYPSGLGSTDYATNESYLKARFAL
jgi:hypothetical protein